MKNLLKISCVLAIVLFVSMNVNAVEPVTGGGTITVSVPDQLAITVTGSTFTLEYAQLAPVSANMTATAAYVIQANVAWDLKIKATLVGEAPATILPFLKYNAGTGAVAVTTSSVTAKSGIMNQESSNIVWTLENMGNFAAGSYDADITYTLAKQ